MKVLPWDPYPYGAPGVSSSYAPRGTSGFGMGDTVTAAGREMDVGYFRNLILAGRQSEIPGALAYAMLPDISRGSGLQLSPAQQAQKSAVERGDYVTAFGQAWYTILAAVLDGASKIVVPPTPGADAPATGSGSGGGAQVSGGASGGVQFVNLTSGNAQALAVGDQWKLTVTGLANTPVTVIGGKNGANDSVRMGETNGAGVWTATGTATAAEIGSWVEAWKVGNTPVGTVSFTVAPKAAGSTGGGGTQYQQQSGGGGSNGGGNGDGGPFSGMSTTTMLMIGAGVLGLLVLGGRK